MSEPTPIRGVPLPASGSSYAGELPSGNKGVAMTPDERMLKLEWGQASLLAEMTKLEAGMAEIVKAQQPKPKSVWPFAGVILTIFIFILTTIWSASKYPDRKEFEDLKKDQDTSRTTLNQDIKLIQLDQVQMRATMTSVEAGQKRTEDQVKLVNDKLDNLLERGNKR